MALVSI